MPNIWMDVDVNLSEVPVNIMSLIDDTDFKTREVAIVYNSAGMDLVWNFVTTAGAMSTTAVTPTTGGDYDWAEQGTDEGMYSIEIPASGGASINNDTEGFGWFTGIADGVLPWRGPIIGFRAAALNNALIDGGDNLQVDLTHIMNTILTEGGGGRLAAAFIKLLDVVTPTLVASDVMRGTDSANTTVPDAAGVAPTAAEIKTEIEQAGSHLALIKAITDILFGFETTISAVQTADTVFDMADGIPNIDDYNNMVVAIKDVSSGYWVVRKVTDYDQTNLRVTIDRDTGFPLAIDDLVKFSNLSYTPTVASGGGASAQEVHEYDVSGIATPGQAGYEIQQRGTHLSR